MPSRQTYLVLLVSLACVLLVGCAKQIATIGELGNLQREIVKQYGEDGVNVNLNNGVSLTVTFINSPLNSKTKTDRARRAKETAVFVKHHYPSIQQVEEIWVVFLRQETRYVVVTTSNGLDHFGFDKEARHLPGPNEDRAAKSPDATLEPTAVYSPARNETDISISRLQLEGDLDYGLALAPHFTVPGDVTGVRLSSSPPQMVSFDFASYSEKSMFPGESKITVLAERKVVFETSAQFSTSKTPDEKFSEFLLLQVPYPAFRRMAAAEKLTFRLGDREYELTEEQVKALRGMTKYVRK